ncbi:MAG: CHAT domain-containing protein, partial [Planctomycetota bacterium JB042]
EQSVETLGVMQVVRLPLTPGARVVLSGCRTASGVALPGEGVQALWRAFLVARASFVLSTLRPVDDRSAAHWMMAFHSAAADGLPLAEAARHASLGWVEGRSRPSFPRGHSVTDEAHPYLWAAWTCVGHDGGPLPRPGEPSPSSASPESPR